jgi:hypothetical protein
MWILGDYATSTPTETFMKKSGDQNTNDIARLRGTRFVTTTDHKKENYMLLHSQPLDSKYCENSKLNNKEISGFSKKQIKTQSIGKMFDHLLDDDKKQKIGLGVRFNWLWRDITEVFYNIKFSIRNHFVWRKTIGKLRPWGRF